MLLMNIPYVAVFILGTIINKLSKQVQMRVLLSSLAIYTIMIFCNYSESGNYISLQLYKYPPRLYYISYGLTMIMLLWVSRAWIVKIISKIGFLSPLVFIGQHTIWCYFWHIFFVWLVTDNINSSFLRFIIVYCGAILLVVIQNLVLNKFLPRISDEQKRKKIAIIFNN